MRQDVLVLTGAGQIGMAMARRMGHGKKILIADWKIENANRIATIMTAAGYDVIPIEWKHTGECFHDRLPADRALRMKWQMLPNYCSPKNAHSSPERIS